MSTPCSVYVSGQDYANYVPRTYVLNAARDGNPSQVLAVILRGLEKAQALLKAKNAQFPDNQQPGLSSGSVAACLVGESATAYGMGLLLLDHRDALCDFSHDYGDNWEFLVSLTDKTIECRQQVADDFLLVDPCDELERIRAECVEYVQEKIRGSVAGLEKLGFRVLTPRTQAMEVGS